MPAATYYLLLGATAVLALVFAKTSNPVVRGFILASFTFFACIITSQAYPILAASARVSELTDALFGGHSKAVSGLVVAVLFAAAAVWAYWREEDPIETDKSRTKVLVETLPRFVAVLVVVNAALYLATVPAITGIHRPFGLRELPLLVIDPLFGLMVYLAIRATFWGLAPGIEPLIRGNTVLRLPGMALQTYRLMARRFAFDGVALHPSFRIPVHQETRHFLLVSAPGGGKTQVLFPLLGEALSRGDSAILYDFKGDYTAAYGEAPAAAVFSPFDARSLAWDIAKDIDTQLRAMEFAAQLVPHQKVREPFFPKAAQDVLVGLLTKLQREKSGTWTLQDLVTLLETRARIVAALERYRPAALTALGNLEDKQAAGVFAELRTATVQLEYLARAFDGERPRFSVREWAASDALREERRLVILRGNQEYRELDGFFTSVVMSLLIKNVLALPDSHERRLWAFLDEFGNLPPVAGIDKLLTAVRSKGLRVVCAVQDIAQIEEAYSRPFAQTFFGAFGTLLAGQANGETAAFLSTAFGQNQVLRTLTSETTSWDSRSVTESQSMPIEKALLDSEFSGLPPPSLGQPATFWLKTAGWPIGQLLYPVTPTPKVFADLVPNERLLAPPEAAQVLAPADDANVAPPPAPTVTSSEPKKKRLIKRDLTGTTATP